MTTDQPPTLVRRAGRPGLIVPVLLMVSLGCNITALIVPFLEIEIFLKGKEDYSLPHSVKLMWDEKLYLIAALIVGFSITFPFAKLIGLTTIWFFMCRPHRRRRVLHVLESLGKWSYMDIFIVIVILVLTHDQFFISAKPVAGIYFFVAAISLSMITSSIIEVWTRSDEPPPQDDGRRHVLIRHAGFAALLATPLLLLSLPALYAAVTTPFVKITQFLFKGFAPNIAGSAGALWDGDTWLLSLIIAAGLMAIPALSVLTMYVVWFTPIRPAARRTWGRLLLLFNHWSMLDVFGLALLVFLTEGDDLVKTRVRTGLYLIIAAIAIWTIAGLLIVRANERLLARRPPRIPLVAG